MDVKIVIESQDGTQHIQLPNIAFDAVININASHEVVPLMNTLLQQKRIYPADSWQIALTEKRIKEAQDRAYQARTLTGTLWSRENLPSHAVLYFVYDTVTVVWEDVYLTRLPPLDPISDTSAYEVFGTGVKEFKHIHS